MIQLVLDFGPEPYRFLYCPAANDPIFDTALYKRARERREEFDELSRRRQWKELIRRQRGRCASCNRRVRPLQIDHHAAVINGGDNSPSNLRLLCRTCHDLKTSMDMLIYQQRTERLIRSSML